MQAYTDRFRLISGRYILPTAQYTSNRFPQLRRQSLLQPIVDDLNNLGSCHPHKVRIPPLYFLEPMRLQRFLKCRFKTLVHFQCSHFSFSYTTDVRYLLFVKFNVTVQSQPSFLPSFFTLLFPSHVLHLYFFLHALPLIVQVLF